MVDYGIPTDSDAGDVTANYVLTSPAADLVNGKQLTPGPGIAIIVAGNTVTVQVSGSLPTSNLTYTTRTDERANLPNSVRLVQGANMFITYDSIAGTLAFSSSASGGGSGPETYFTLNHEPTLANARQLTFGNNIFTVDGGAGGTFSTQIDKSSSDVAGTINLLTTSNKVRLSNANAGTLTYNLPVASSALDKQFEFKKTDLTTNAITIVPNGTDKIDGQVSYSFNLSYMAIRLHCDGSGNWFLI